MWAGSLLRGDAKLASDYSGSSRRATHSLFKRRCACAKLLAWKGGPMGRIVHTSRIHITREKGPTRKALIEGFSEPVYYGVHGGIKSFYKVEPEKEHAATLDHIVGAVAG